jgi:hypothetical protein
MTQVISGAAARRHGDAVGAYADQLLDADLPSTKMRQVWAQTTMSRISTASIAAGIRARHQGDSWPRCVLIMQVRRFSATALLGHACRPVQTPLERCIGATRSPES